MDEYVWKDSEHFSESFKDRRSKSFDRRMNHYVVTFDVPSVDPVDRSIEHVGLCGMEIVCKPSAVQSPCFLNFCASLSSSTVSHGLFNGTNAWLACSFNWSPTKNNQQRNLLQASKYMAHTAHQINKVSQFWNLCLCSMCASFGRN